MKTASDSGAVILLMWMTVGIRIQRSPQRQKGALYFWTGPPLFGLWA